MVFKYLNDNYYHGEWTGSGPAPPGYASPNNIPEAYNHAAEASILADQAAENARLHPTVTVTTQTQTTGNVTTSTSTTKPVTSNFPSSNLASQAQKLLSGSNSNVLIAIAAVLVLVGVLSK